MKPKVNYHTHTVFCDGTDSPEELVLEAIRQGFDEIGFSGHACTPIDASMSMSPEDTRRYIAEIAELRDRFSDKIKIYCGLETDIYSVYDAEMFDYIIGSVHYVERGNVYYPVDMSREDFIKAVATGWGGDVYAFIEDYYELTVRTAENPATDIIGHLDLITKFNEDGSLFSESNERYIRASENAVSRILKTKKPFEINTGAMSRGFRTVPYPSDALLKLIAKGGGEVIISSDCHKKEYLDFGFDEAEAAAERAGVHVCRHLPKKH